MTVLPLVPRQKVSPDRAVVEACRRLLPAPCTPQGEKATAGWNEQDRAEKVRASLERGGFVFTPDPRAVRALRKAEYLDWNYSSFAPAYPEHSPKSHRKKILDYLRTAPDRNDSRGIWNRPKKGWEDAEMDHIANGTGFFRHASADIRIAMESHRYCGGLVRLSVMVGSHLSGSVQELAGPTVSRQFSEPSETTFREASWTIGRVAQPKQSLLWRRGKAQSGGGRVSSYWYWFTATRTCPTTWTFLKVSANMVNYT